MSTPSPNRFRSVARWPEDSAERISLGNTANESDDTHDSQDAASIVCTRLRMEGFGGNGITRPTHTRVEEIDAAGSVVRIVEEWPNARRARISAEDILMGRPEDGEEKTPEIDSDPRGEWRADSRG